MIHRRAPLALCLLTLLAALPASAQALRTWVSGVGDDSNPCSRTAPCKTLAGAISKTAAQGEIDVLDPAGVGAVTITKSITIDGLSRQGSIQASGTNGVVISETGGTDTITVTLRGLSIISPANGVDGVKVLHGKAVHLEDCVITGFDKGIESGAAPTALFVRDTVISESRTAGLSINQGSAVIESSQLSTSQVGVDASGTAQVTLRDSTVAGNAAHGIHAQGSAEVNVEHAAISANGTGVLADAPARVRLSEVMVSGNTTGVSGNVLSFQNNRIAAGNTTDGAPSSTLSQQ